MSDYRQIDRIRAERLLDGDDRGTDAVGRLLAVARGPVRPEELRLEAEAVGAFRAAAWPAGAMAPPRRPVTAARRRLWPRMVGVKAASVTLAVALGGVALAAGTGALSNPIDAQPVPTSAAPPTPPVSPLTSNANRRSPSFSQSSSPNASAATGNDHASLVGLCRAYQARGDRDPGAAMGSAAFAGLVAAAGGLDEVASFCADLLGGDDKAKDDKAKDKDKDNGDSAARVRGRAPAS